MPLPASHRVIPAEAMVVPKPFKCFAVRSDEPAHAWLARAPWGQVHVLRPAALAAQTLARLAADGHARVQIDGFSHVTYAPTTWPELAAVTPGAPGLAAQIAAALQRTGVLGPGGAAYHHSVAQRIDYLACCGAGFHNDVNRHWSRSLFWLLALDLADVAFVMPHAGVHIALAPGDLLVFDPVLAHGLCRPRDGGQAVAASFETGLDPHQMFLTGEILLSDAQWAALGAPWLPIETHAARGALDLMVASFDERSGAIQRVQALKGGFLRSTCHVDSDPPAEPDAGLSGHRPPRTPG